MMKGGKLLGSPGKTGATYDFCSCHYDKDTFCSQVQSIWPNVKALYVIDTQMKKTRLLPDFKVIESLTQPHSNIVAKYYHSSNAKKDFQTELHSIALIQSCYDQNLPDYTTLSSSLHIENVRNVIGLILETKTVAMYYTFQNKCDTRLTDLVIHQQINFDKIVNFLSDILNSLIILQSKNMRHGDIKFDNVMTRDGKFILIDWGFAKQFRFAETKQWDGFKPYLRGSSPLYYVMHTGLHWRLFVDNYVHDCMLTNHFKIDKDSMQQFAYECYENFYENIAPNYKKQQLFETFKFTCDLWSLGLMIYAMCHNTPFSYLAEYSKMLCLFRKTPYGSYIMNAQQALEIFEKFFKHKKLDVCGLDPQYKGIHGMLIDTCCDLTIASKPKYILCQHIKQLETSSTSEFKLYTNHMQTIEISGKTVTHFNDMLKSYNDTIAVKYYSIPHLSYKDMKDDIMNSHTVESIYTGNDAKYINTSTFNFMNHTIAGMMLNDGFTKHYYYFSQRCNNTVDKQMLSQRELIRMVSDVLQSLTILHNNGYMHGDVKGPNIMKCGNMYKLIDWGRLKTISRFSSTYEYGGSLQMGSPLSFYFMVRNKTKQLVPQKQAAQFALYIFEFKKRCPLFQKPYDAKFVPLWEDIKSSFVSLFTTNTSDHELFDTFKHTLDTYNIGLTIFYLLLRNKMNVFPYMEFIRKMVLYKPGQYLNPKEALLEWHRLHEKN